MKVDRQALLLLSGEFMVGRFDKLGALKRKIRRVAAPLSVLLKRRSLGIQNLSLGLGIFETGWGFQVGTLAFEAPVAGLLVNLPPRGKIPILETPHYFFARGYVDKSMLQVWFDSYSSYISTLDQSLTPREELRGPERFTKLLSNFQLDDVVILVALDSKYGRLVVRDGTHRLAGAAAINAEFIKCVLVI